MTAHETERVVRFQHGVDPIDLRTALITSIEWNDLAARLQESVIQRVIEKLRASQPHWGIEIDAFAEMLYRASSGYTGFYRDVAPDIRAHHAAIAQKLIADIITLGLPLVVRGKAREAAAAVIMQWQSRHYADDFSGLLHLERILGEMIQAREDDRDVQIADWLESRGLEQEASMVRSGDLRS
jgi:hypothetical protein